MALDNESAFDLSWTSPRYAPIRPEADGRWRTLLSNNQPVAVVWTDNDAGAGVAWISQTAEVEKLRRHFGDAFEAGTTATLAYQIACDNLGLRFYDEDSGKLSAVDDELAGILEELS